MNTSPSDRLKRRAEWDEKKEAEREVRRLAFSSAVEEFVLAA